MQKPSLEEHPGCLLCLAQNWEPHHPITELDLEHLIIPDGLSPDGLLLLLKRLAERHIAAATAETARINGFVDRALLQQRRLR